MLGLLPFQGVVYLLNQYHRALPWAKSKLCPFRAQADKTIFRKAQQAKASHRTHVKYVLPLCFRCASVSSPFLNYRINGGRAKDQRRINGGSTEDEGSQKRSRREAEGKQKGREIPNNKHLDVCHMEIVRLGSPSYASPSL